MKKKLLFLAGITALLVVISIAAASLTKREAAESSNDADVDVVTSFYPIYVAAKNLTEGVPGIALTNLTPNQTGCLHDYQITTEDMKRLENADVLLLNGGGMESFVEKIAANLPKLKLIYSDEGIMMREGEEHEHHHDEEHGHEEHDHEEHEEHEGHEHDHDEGNSHMWLDPVRYEQQVRNLAKGLVELDPVHRTIYEANCEAYVSKIRKVAQEYSDAFEGAYAEPAVIFHEAFEYLEDTTPINVVHAIEIEGDNSALSAAEMAEVIEEIREQGVRYLIIEEQFKASIADGLSKETGTEVIVLDSLVTGNGSADAWTVGMEENLKILKSILSEGR